MVVIKLHNYNTWGAGKMLSFCFKEDRYALNNNALYKMANEGYTKISGIDFF